MKPLFATKNSHFNTTMFFGLAVVALLTLAASTAQADWPSRTANIVSKHSQLPDLTPFGYNVLAAQPPAGSGAGQPLILADDFPCTMTGPITDIHIWASWLGDAGNFAVPPIPITLGIWSDVPAVAGPTGPMPSHPGELLWSQTFVPGPGTPGTYKIASWPFPSAPSPFWDPGPPSTIMGTDNITWLYNFYPDPAQPNGLFVQQGTAATPTNYWLSVTAGADVAAFGWKVSAVQQGDNAVFGHMDASGTTPLGDWQELFDPLQVPTKSLDLAFAITTTNQTLPPPPPPPNKWVQYPDLYSGYGLDVNATRPNTANGLQTLADDFQCNVASPITNIQFWASIKGDVTPGPNTFVVSIWTDAPKGSAGLPYSEPGVWQWSQTYGPGDYTIIGPPVTGTENFYDPANPGTPPSPESVVWLYNFNVFATNPFCQQGNGTVYWVLISSLSTNTPFTQWGWKTSTNHWNDTGVIGILDPSSKTTLVPWQPLYNPLVPAAVPADIDFAFRISSGPPSPDCDPAVNGVGNQPPDTSTNGLDVWAVTPTTVGDDFLCQVAGQISGFRIWGSWLNDQVDTNATFEVSLWQDVPAAVGSSPYSHPGSLVCSSTFYPPQTPQTSCAGILRYQYRQFANNLQENFFNPNISGPAGLIGTDTQIWSYDFFPFVPSCFVQDGGPFANGRNYWVTVSYQPLATGAGNYFFGWKTSTKHYNDAAVFGVSPGPWTPLFDPRNGAQLDLAKWIWKFPITGINKDMVNNTGTPADGIQVTLLGPHLITWHYDGCPPFGPWQTFAATTDAAGNTVLTWSNGVSVPPGGVTHVGFETPGGVLPKILGWNWLSGGVVIGSARQGNWHLLGDPFDVFFNDFESTPGPTQLGGGSVEFYMTPPPLDQMTPTGARSPMATMQLPAVQGTIPSGGASSVPIPSGPPGAQYALMIISLTDSLGNPGATDFELVPLDAALAPAIQSIGVSGGNVMINFSSVYGRSYQLQSSSSLGAAASWGNMGGQIMAVGADIFTETPVGGAQSFYRVMLVP